MAPTIRAAAADAAGHLWVSFVEPFTYVFDADGDKIRTVQFRAAGTIAPDSLFFEPGGRLLVTPGLYMFDVRSRYEAEAGGWRLGALVRSESAGLVILEPRASSHELQLRPDPHFERHRPLQDVAEDVLLDVLVEQVGHLDHAPSPSLRPLRAERCRSPSCTRR